LMLKMTMTELKEKPTTPDKMSFEDLRNNS